jgi:alpha-galactosidase
MRSTKIVIIGAASTSFGPDMIADALLTPELRGSTVVLVDIDAERLEVMAAFFRRLNTLFDAGLTIEQTTDRKRALPGAEFVITAIAIRRAELWRRDWEIPLKYGIKHIFAENGGPGGLSHALRNIPMILDIARDIEKLAPNALLLNFTNPESRIGLALSRYTSLNFVGLCHGIGMGYDSISLITGIPRDDLTGIAAGLNHFAWFLDIRRKSTKEDVYPALRAADAAYDPTYYPLTRYLFRHYGLYPHPADDHIGEYLSFAYEFTGMHGPHLDNSEERRAETLATIARIARGDGAVSMPGDTGSSEDAYHVEPSGEFAFPIIVSMVDNRRELIEAVNITNNGIIPNLPDWAVVEVPAVAGADGIKGVRLGALPRGVAALLNTQVHVQDLVIEAAVHGSRELALESMLADPVVQSADAAEKCLDELLSVHAPYLPQFKH